MKKIISDEIIIKNVVELMNLLIASPSLIIENQQNDAPKLEVIRLNNEINRELSKTYTSDDNLKHLLLQCTEVKYMAL